MMIYTKRCVLTFVAVLGAMLAGGHEAPAASSPTGAIAGVADRADVAVDGFPYRLVRRIPLDRGASVGALAFGPAGAVAYVAAGKEVRGFDVATGRPDAAVNLSGAITGLAASAGGGGVLYAVVGAPAQLVTLRLHTLQIASSVPLSDGAPSAVLYDAGQQALYVESADARTIARFDPGSGKRLGAVNLPGNPQQMAADGRGTLYVADAAHDALDVIDTAQMRFVGSIPLPDCRAPSGLAMEPVGRRLFVACSNSTALVVDADLGFTFERTPIAPAKYLRAAFAFRPLGPSGWKGGAFIAGDGGALDAVQMKSFVSYAGGGHMVLDGAPGALALDPAAKQLWLAVAPKRATPSTRRPAGGEDQTSGPEILVLGAANEEMSP